MWYLRRRGRGDRGHVLFGANGWLFADLMLALVMAFLVANTVGQPKPPTTTTSTTTTTTTIPTTTTTLPVLHLKPERVRLEGIDHEGLLSGDTAAVADAERKLKADAGITRLARESKRVGLVMVFGGAPNDDRRLGYEIARQFRGRVLEPLGAQGFLFQDTVYPDEFSHGDGYGIISLHVYYFE